MPIGMEGVQNTQLVNLLCCTNLVVDLVESRETNKFMHQMTELQRESSWPHFQTVDYTESKKQDPHLPNS